MLPQKGCATFLTMWAARKSCLQSCRLDSGLPHPVTVLQQPIGGSLPGCLLLQWGRRRWPYHAQMPPWADAECSQVRQRLAHAQRHPTQASAFELTKLQHQVQGMRKHKKCNHFNGNRADFEAASRAGHWSFWTPCKKRNIPQCPVPAQAQLACMQRQRLPLSSCFPASNLLTGTGILHLMWHNLMLTSLLERLESALQRVKCGKAAGHDGLYADLLKDADPALLEEYVHLSTFCLQVIYFMLFL